ncbi:putative disease resistance protein RGA4 [Vitis vinifera]|uniref:Putative disease resistance protein RGA4 n=1 Tax=Vitis vinifera TaxID=29760 RepID=A0A438H558_VITVI|nr:putative disease resistance protein RGA4 [Vitis vinifera]
MAQSYLDSKSDREMETIGREYFENLAAQSFFQDFEKDDKGNIVRCKIHDRVHDLAQFLTNNECLIVEDDCENLKANLSRQKGRHATLIQFKYLRAMDLRGNDTIVELPREVGEFIHLRYLNLSRCRALKTLPETICGLCNLQTLDEFSEQISLAKGVGRLTSLRTLPFFIVSDEGKIEEMRNLKELRGRLEIRGLVNVEDAEKAEKGELKNKKHLHGLTLHFTTGRMQERMKKVAEALQPHPNLKSLSIVEYQVREWPSMSVLASSGELPLLENLNIQYMWRVKYVGGEFLGSSSAIAFPRLKHLGFSEMQEWEIWEVKEEGRKVMPSLLSLKISASPKLATLPDLLQRTPPLDLSFKYCNILQGKWPWLLKVTARV